MLYVGIRQICESSDFTFASFFLLLLVPLYEHNELQEKDYRFFYLRLHSLSMCNVEQ